MLSVAHLHKKGISHLNVTPENILLFGDGESGVTAKLANFTFYNSDHVLSKNDRTIGWRSPERLLGRQEGLSSDIFSLALVIFHLVSRGSHPFGRFKNIEQCEKNIMLNKLDKRLEDTLPPDAVDFLKDMLADKPTQRPQVETMLSHPLLWDRTKRGHFLCELNNMIQGLGSNSAEVVYLNSFANVLITDRKHGWKCKFNIDFINEVGTRNDGFKYGRFDVKELLRFVRNMLQHFDDYPDYLGSSMDSAYGYVLDLIPELIVIGYNIIKRENHEGTDRFKRYFCN